MINSLRGRKISAILKSWVINLVLWCLRCYQRLISPLLGPHCRFYPSCSQYAIESITAHGIVNGSWLTIIRLSKCQPFHPGGVDFVPPSNERAVQE